MGMHSYMSKAVITPLCPWVLRQYNPFLCDYVVFAQRIQSLTESVFSDEFGRTRVREGDGSPAAAADPVSVCFSSQTNCGLRLMCIKWGQQSFQNKTSGVQFEWSAVELYN